MCSIGCLLSRVCDRDDSDTADNDNLDIVWTSNSGYDSSITIPYGNIAACAKLRLKLSDLPKLARDPDIYVRTF